jgi:pimeloyl-ACP methyl ester carboxylesterase
MRLLSSRFLGSIAAMSAALALVVATIEGESEGSEQKEAICASISRRPVIFVHGSGLSPDTWREMKAVFQSRGYPASHLVAVRLHPDNGSNSRAAARFVDPAVRDALATSVRRAEQSHCRPPMKVDIVAHSMGAVSGRWYVSQIDATRVLNFVGIAPANHGTNALCSLAGDGNRELCPAFAQTAQQSALQLALNGSRARVIDETPYGLGSDAAQRPRIVPTSLATIYYWTIRLEPDEWIDPASSALLDGAGGRPLPRLPTGARETSPGNILWPTGTGHDELPRNPELIDFVLRLLSEPN